MQRITEQQKLTIEELKKEEKESREKGEAIYHNYQLIKEVLEELNKASKKYSWKETDIQIWTYPGCMFISVRR